MWGNWRAGMRACLEWAGLGEGQRKREFRAYIRNVAEARYVIRRILRIAEDRAKEHGLEPLTHQALLQVYGTDGDITVGRLAARLDIAAAFASRLMRRLDEMGLVTRTPSETDRRVTIVTATKDGAEKLSAIDDDMHRHGALLHHELSADERHMALSVFAFYVGLDPPRPVARAIRAGAGH
ncbi:MarR family winged helix-turn-helix transcriptional regulator [Streptomyces sp. NPDC093064]|uniref:MarR family winged helix-turn-helix transcriptional regulator n=1 Tax=Streptomyces sp. NPDC093064 TaxID=3366020 RepID=UPI003821A98D